MLECRGLGRILGKRVEQPTDSLREPAHDGVRERHCPLEPRTAHELNGLVHRRVLRDFGVAELVRAEPQCCANRWVELADWTLAELSDGVVERAHALHRSERESLRECMVATVEVLCGTAEHAVRICVLFEYTEDDFVRRLTGCHRS